MRLLLLSGLLLLGCSSRPKDFIGSWKGEILEVTDTIKHERVSVPIEKYGLLQLRLDQDSTFLFNLAVLKDVKVEKAVLGLKQNVVLLPAVYRSTKIGRFTKTSNSVLTLPSHDGSIFVESDASRENYHLQFTDRAGRAWSCTIVPNDE